MNLPHLVNSIERGMTSSKSPAESGTELGGEAWGSLGTNLGTDGKFPFLSRENKTMQTPLRPQCPQNSS